MTRKNVFRWIRLAPLAGAAALVIPMTAFAAGSSVQPTSGTLIAKGTAVAIDVSFTCPAGGTLGAWGYGGINLSVQQAVSKTEQATGSVYGGVPGTCTGSMQTATVTAMANVPGPPFRNGPAIVNAYLFGTDANGSSFSAQSGPVTMRLGN